MNNMNEHTPLEPLSPEDMELIIGLAKPMYAESKNVERMTGTNTVVNGRPDDGSSKIRSGLEQIARSVQVQRPSTPPIITYVNPHVSSGETSTSVDPNLRVVPTTNPLYDPNLGVHSPIVSSPQMELDFDVSEQKRTNDLLEEISRKLTKLVYHFIEKPTGPRNP